MPRPGLAPSRARPGKRPAASAARESLTATERAPLLRGNRGEAGSWRRGQEREGYFMPNMSTRW